MTKISPASMASTQLCRAEHCAGFTRSCSQLPYMFPMMPLPPGYIIIFCRNDDAVARALYTSLFDKGKRELRLVSDSELALAVWLHEAGNNGRFFTRIKLQDGFIIEPAIIKTAVNRLHYFPMPHFINAADRLYAETEMFALYISFLRSLGNKLIDGMPVRHINHMGGNQLYCYSMALAAGMQVLDNYFSSSPRWYQPAAMKALAPGKATAAAWHKPSQHLIWENKPVLYNRSFSALVKVEIVDHHIFSDVLPVEKYREKISSFSQNTGRKVYTITFAAVKKDYKFYATDNCPAVLSNAAIKAFAALVS